MADMPSQGWLNALRVYRQPRVIAMIFLGFSAGLPFLLVFSTLSAWLRDEGVARSIIGYFGWVGMTYSVKVLWAPIVDKVPLLGLTQWLGRRRSWLLFAQLGIALGLYYLAQLNVETELERVAICAVFIAFCSATQDIVIDAFRIEAAEAKFQGAMAAAYVFGYRLALLMAGAGALYIADFYSWQMAYRVMATLMGVGIVTTLLLKEPAATILTKDAHSLAGGLKPSKKALAWFVEAVISPVSDFFRRFGRFGFTILALVAVYKLSDITMGMMANPFYLDLGFTKQEIAQVTKVFGFFMTLLGAFIGGVMVVRHGIIRPLVLGAVLIATTNLLFSFLAVTEPDLQWLAIVVSMDNLSGGLATAVFIAYLSSLTSSAHTATQYALFSSLMTLPAKFISGFSGVIVDSYGYYHFFLFAAGLGLPAIILAVIVFWRSKAVL
ncbi:MAG: MFS transporter [Methylococcales bacterium]|nr:MFS transporter [Methylococcaceae bacterium]